MEPLELRRAGAQIERKRPGAEDHLGLGEQPVALLARPRAVGVAAEVARRGVGRPCLPDLAVVPAAGVRQPHRRVDGLDLRPLRVAEARDGEDVDGSHALLPKDGIGTRDAPQDARILSFPPRSGREGSHAFLAMNSPAWVRTTNAPADAIASRTRRRSSSSRSPTIACFASSKESTYCTTASVSVMRSVSRPS